MKFDGIPNLATLPTPVDLRTDGFVDLTDAERDAAKAAVQALQWQHVLDAAKPQPAPPLKRD